MSASPPTIDNSTKAPLSRERKKKVIIVSKILSLESMSMLIGEPGVQLHLHFRAIKENYAWVGD